MSLDLKTLAARIALPVAGILCLFPFVGAPVALLAGIALALALGNPYIERTRKLTPYCLATAVIGLGAGMDLSVVAQVGAQGIVYTVAGIALTMSLGLVLGRRLKVDGNTSLLVTVGTAICGGSAIAAIAPIVKAPQAEIGVALGIVFLLNAAALILFPFIGHALDLSQHQFGLWGALAIHDTSSVVGAGLQYGPQALETGTTVKLARALWIIPLAFSIAFVHARHNPEQAGRGKIKIPWFIFGFVAAAALTTFIPALQPAGDAVESLARRLLVLTLFLIGTGLTRDTLRAVGLAPFLQGLVLWLIVAGLTLTAILLGWIA